MILGKFQGADLRNLEVSAFSLLEYLFETANLGSWASFLENEWPQENRGCSKSLQEALK